MLNSSTLNIVSTYINRKWCYTGQLWHTLEVTILILPEEPPSYSFWTSLVLKKIVNKSTQLNVHKLILLSLSLALSSLLVRQQLTAANASFLPLNESAQLAFLTSQVVKLNNFDSTPATLTLNEVISQETNPANLDSIKVESSQPLTHRVEVGETISQIAQSYNISSWSLLSKNPSIQNTDMIEIGDILNIPTPAEAQSIQEPVVAVKKVVTSVSTVTFSSPPSLKAEQYKIPVQGALETQGFSSYHPGVDLAAPIGTPVYATKSGCFSTLASGWNGGYGNTIVQDLGKGYTARYAHLLYFGTGLKTGSCVNKGDVVGYVGSTGRSTGPHLHFELRYNGSAFDPEAQGLVN